MSTNLNRNIKLNNNFISLSRESILKNYLYIENNNFIFKNIDIATKIKKSTKETAYINFNFKIHSNESSDEINPIFNVKFYYNFYNKNYQEYISNTSFNNENYLLNFYKQQYKNYSRLNKKTKFLDIDNNNFYNINNASLSSIIYYTDEFFSNTNTNFYNFINKTNSIKDQLPFYSEISYNTINSINTYKNSLSKILEDFSIYKTIFEYFVDSPKINNNENKYIILDDFLKNLPHKNKVNLLIKLSDFVEKNKTSTVDIVQNNKETYYEIIGYKIEKFVGSSKNAIQQFYIANTEQQKNNFVDFQIFYGKQYSYKISYVVAAISTNPSIMQILEGISVPGLVNTPQIISARNNFNKNTQIKGFSTINSQSVVSSTAVEPYVTIQDTNSIYLFEVEGLRQEGFALDYPPIKPEANFIPYVGIANTVKILLNASTGKYSELPIVLNDNEQTQIDKFLINQQSNDKKLIYQSEGDPSSYRVYRLEYFPKTYKEFLNGVITDLPNIGSSASFEDNIASNKKYYYIFRAIDKNGYLSNPTHIHIFEMVNDGGNIYPLLEIKKIEDYADISYTDITKPMQQYLSIKPTIMQILFEQKLDENFNQITNKDEALKQIKIGGVYPSLFGKKFKIRLTSKSSGKKIDINVNFNLKIGK